MNKHDPGGPEAVVRYGDNEVTILRQGLFPAQWDPKLGIHVT